MYQRSAVCLHIFLTTPEILFIYLFLISTGVDEKTGQNFLVCHIHCETDGCNVANHQNTINHFLLVFGLGVIFLKNWMSHFTNSIFHFDKSFRKVI